MKALAETNLSGRIVLGSIDRANRIKGNKNATTVLSSKIIQSKIKKKAENLKKQQDSNDILSSGVLDFVSNNKSNGTTQVLGKDFQYFKSIYQTTLPKSKRMGNLCNQVIVFDKEKTLQEIIIAAKLKINNMKSDQSKKQADANSLVKVLSTYNGNGELEQDEYNETEYVFYFIEPFFRNILRYSQVKLKCGDSFLKVAAKDENEELYDEEHQSKGPRIDIIIRNKLFDIDIVTVEVSRQNNKVNQVQSTGDRFKLSKNMKIILTHIIDASPFASPIKRRKLKIYSFHIYLNVLYIYSLHKPDDNNFVFQLERRFSIPTNMAKLPAEFAVLVSNMWIVEKLIKDTKDQIEALLEISKQHLVLSSNSNSSSDEDSDSRPRKLQK